MTDTTISHGKTVRLLEEASAILINKAYNPGFMATLSDGKGTDDVSRPDIVGVSLHGAVRLACDSMGLPVSLYVPYALRIIATRNKIDESDLSKRVLAKTKEQVISMVDYAKMIYLRELRAIARELEEDKKQAA